jgi:hypothetical protein
MTFFKAAPAVFCMAFLGTALSPNAKADEWNDKTVVTFSAPVEIPGVHLKGWAVLPAGTYVFKLLDSKSDRHIVQIFSKDELTVYATILAIPNYRLKATDKTTITFRERPAGEPEALRAWFYPGKNWGEEFVYPKARAMELAKSENTPVLFTEVDIPVEVIEPIQSVDHPVVAQLKRAPIMAVQPTGEAVQLAQAVTPPPAAEMQPTAAPVQTAQLAAKTLPATASSVPLLALFGFLTLGAALTIRSIKTRVL